MKWFTLDDFLAFNLSIADSTRNYLNNFNALIILSPDYSNLSNPFVMNNDGTDIRFKRVDVIYDICNNKTSGGTFYSNDNILNYLYDL